MRNEVNKKAKTINERKEQKKMTKTMKKIISVFITAAMVMILGVTAFADTANVDITRPDKDEATHTYKAYQIFKGDVEEVPGSDPKQYVMTHLVWGDGVDHEALVDDLMDPAKYAKADDFDGCDGEADSVAAIIADYSEADALAFAKVVAKHIIAAKAKTATGDSFTGLDKGYYLFTDSIPNNSNGAVSEYMLKAVDIHTMPDDEAEAKEDLPTLDKKIVENDTEVEANRASVGDDIQFRIKSVVPDLRNQGYENYWFVVTDTLCRGLKYNGDAKVYINGIQYPEAKVDITTTGADDGSDTSTVYISLDDFLAVATDATKVRKNIVIEYTAELTKDCDMTTAGNVNTAQLIFSNDPNVDYSGDYNPDGPNPNVGKTPEKKTKTYTTGIAVIKVDNSTPAKRLTGAEFQIELSGDSTKTVVIETEVYTKDATADPAYYLLPDGSYSESSTGAVSTDKYKKEIVRDTQTTTETVKTVKATVDDQGYLVFEGLGEGTYKIKETKAPTGYIADIKEHTIVIGHSAAPTFDAPNWTYKVDSESASSAEVTLEFVNVKSSNLPETGGIGTTVFYIAGSVLVLAGASLLVMKKRMSEETK